MTTGATGQLGLALPVQGELSGTWGDTVNNGITQYTNIAIAGTLTLTGDGAVTLANTTGDASASNITSTLAGAGTVTAQFAIVKVSGTTTTKVVTGPSYSKTYVVDNASSFAVTFKASGQTGVSIAAAEKVTVVFNGTDYIKLAGTIANAAGSNTQIQFNNGGLFGASANLTWDGTTLSSTQVNITGQGTLRLQDTTGGEYVGLRSPSALGASYTLTFPADDGTSGQALITDGSGVLSWSTAASGDVYGPGSSTDNAVARFDSTTGKLLQNSVVIIGDTGAVTGVTDLTASGSVTLSGGTANGVAYLNGSKVVTSGSALTFNGTNFKNTSGYISANTDFRLTDASFSRVAVTDGGGGFVGGYNITYSGSPVYDSTGSIAGIYNSNAGNVVFYAGGSASAGTAAPEGMRLTSTGLGIGTSSPSFRLDVQAPTGVIKLTATTGTNASYFRADNTGGILYFGLDDSVASTFGTAGAYGTVIQRPASTAFNINRAGTVDMYINTTGNVGIGTTSPSEKLAVAGNVTADILKLRSNQSAPSSTDAFIYRPADNTIGFGTASAEKMRLDSSGNLGLGLTPSAYLSTVKAIDISSAGAVIGGSANIGLAANAYLNSSGNWIYKNSSTYAAKYTPNYANNGSHVWEIAASGTAGNAITFTQAMTLDASGNLLVNTTTASGKLTIAPAVSQFGTVINAPSSSGTYYFEAFQAAGTGIGSITSTNGTVTLYNSTSDYRLKNVIGAVTGQGARIDALEPIEYEWKSDGSRTRGFLAHKFQEVYAGSVTGTKDAVDANGNPEYQAMQAGSAEVIADLIAEIQSLRKRLADAGI